MLDTASLEKEIIEKFYPKKKYSLTLAASYFRLGELYESRSYRTSQCGTILKFVRSLDDDVWHLHDANFCRDRLCPMCSWRRSYKIYSQLSKILDYLDDNYVYLFLTLTVPNCENNELSKVLDDLQTGFRELFRIKKVKTSIKGYFRSFEITRNHITGTYHPHIHSVLAARKDYFDTDKPYYINQSEWLDMWRTVMHDPKISQVDIRRCKSKGAEFQRGEIAAKSIKSAVLEAAKYSVKSVDYLYPANPVLTDEIVETLAAALYRRRLCSFGGVFKDARKELQLDDPEDGDLIHIDDDNIRGDVGCMIATYNWSAGCYKLSDLVKQVNLVADPEDDD